MSQVEGEGVPHPVLRGDALDRKVAIPVDPQSPRADMVLEMVQAHLPIPAIAQLAVDYLDLPRNWAVWGFHQLGVPRPYFDEFHQLRDLLFFNRDEAAEQYVGHFVRLLIQMKADPKCAHLMPKMEAYLRYLWPQLMKELEAGRGAGPSPDAEAIDRLGLSEHDWLSHKQWVEFDSNVVPVGANMAVRARSWHRRLRAIDVEIAPAPGASKGIPRVTCEARGSSDKSKNLIPGLERCCVNPESPRVVDEEFDPIGWYKYEGPAHVFDRAELLLSSATWYRDGALVTEYFRELSEAPDLGPDELWEYVKDSLHDCDPKHVAKELADGIASLRGLSDCQKEELTQILSGDESGDDQGLSDA